MSSRNLLGIIIFVVAIFAAGGTLLIYNKEVVTNAVSSVISTLSFKSTNSAPPAGTWGTTTPAFGIAAGGGLPAYGKAELDQRFKDMADLGVKWVRIDIDWNNVQNVSSKESHWGDYDKVIDAAVTHNFKVLGIIDYTPAWARVENCSSGAQCAPKDPSLYAQFASEVVNRYKNKGVRYWEIWNEPNIQGFWAPKANCKAYTALMKKAYVAIKIADPYATVITGGTAPASTDGQNVSPVDFLKCIYDAGGKDYFDAVSHHPYTYPNFPSSRNNMAWAQMASTTPSLRSLMIANGDGLKKVWLTEYGTPTGGPGTTAHSGTQITGARHVDEQVQANTVTDVFKLYRSYDWVGPLFWYSYKDTGTATTTNENFFGLLRADGSRKPAYDVFKEGAVIPITNITKPKIEAVPPSPIEYNDSNINRK